MCLCVLNPVDDVVDESDDNDETEADTENDSENEEDEKNHSSAVRLTLTHHIWHDSIICYTHYLKCVSLFPLYDSGVIETAQSVRLSDLCHKHLNNIPSLWLKFTKDCDV